MTKFCNHYLNMQQKIVEANIQQLIFKKPGNNPLYVYLKNPKSSENKTLITK